MGTFYSIVSKGAIEFFQTFNRVKTIFHNCATGGGERSRSLPRRVVQSKAARKIFPFLASFRSSQSRDQIASTSTTPTTPTKNEPPPQSINVATTIENNLGEEIVIEDSQKHLPQCTATTTIIENLCNIKSDEDAAVALTSKTDDDDGADFISPKSSSSAILGDDEGKIEIAETISQPSEIAISAAIVAPRVSVESVQVIASTDVINQTDSPGSEQRRYELKCGDEFYVVDGK
uniref:Uncharacterized protein n=1 Tax=Panagrolaimus sp. PS1159 TaxID=55785 RepID=A0AC35GCY1_9BILA